MDSFLSVWGAAKIECDLESKWCGFPYDPASSVVPQSKRRQVRWGKGEWKDTGREEEQNKKDIALVCSNLIYASSIVSVRLWSSAKARVHFLVTVVGEISREQACFHSGNNEECVLAQTPHPSRSRPEQVRWRTSFISPALEMLRNVQALSFLANPLSFVR